jgi:hypothetical protein
MKVGPGNLLQELPTPGTGGHMYYHVILDAITRLGKHEHITSREFIYEASSPEDAIIGAIKDELGLENPAELEINTVGIQRFAIFKDANVHGQMTVYVAEIDF